MKTHYKILLLCLLLPVLGRSQASLDTILAAVRAANKSLITAKLVMEGEMRGARTGIYLPNPEVEFDYLWGDPASMGNRTDFGISQRFDFPSVYFQRSTQSGMVRNGSTLRYIQKEREMLLEATSAWIRMVTLNRQHSLLNQRVTMAREIAGNAKVRLSKGDIDVIRYHHAQMEYVNLKLELNEIEVMQQSMVIGLAQLCGGKTIPVADTLFPEEPKRSLEEMLACIPVSPSVKSRENEVSIKQLDKNIAVSEWLPSFSAGYYSEVVSGLKYSGITTGISIPLWQNSNTVKRAESHSRMAQAELDETISKETARVTALFHKREKLHNQVTEIHAALLPINDVALLKKALDAGEINISEFYFELSVFYTTWQGLLKAENELALTNAELYYVAGK
jgi:cobalt-zinc-cadmium efflux system outer membrane protein